jgi:hypothetical protein
MDENPGRISISPKKLEANRRNARLSTGPRTEVGKNHSRLNALTHGVLSSVLVVSDKELESPAEFAELLRELARDLEPVGKLEEMLVEKIAVCWWRQQRALRFEARRICENSEATVGSRGRDDFSLPFDGELIRILRYETSVHRQLVYAINQLERMQRTRKGEVVPAPVTVQVSSGE